jgi:hypothetical protein
MSATAATKFAFGDDFGLERRDGMMRRAQDRAALEEAEQRGYAAGFAAGQNMQMASDEAQLASTLRMIESTLGQFTADRDRFLQACEHASAMLAHDLATLHGDIVAGYDPLAAFSAAARETLLNFTQAARIVARVPIEMRDAAEARLNKLAADLRFSGALSVEALPTGYGAADFTLEWPEGSLRFDRATLRARLAEEFQRCGFSLTDKSDCDE